MFRLTKSCLPAPVRLPFAMLLLLVTTACGTHPNHQVRESDKVDASNTEKALVLVGVDIDAEGQDAGGWQMGWLPTTEWPPRMIRHWAWSNNPVFITDSPFIGPILFEGTHFKLLAVEPAAFQLATLDIPRLLVFDITLLRSRALAFYPTAKTINYIGTYELSVAEDDCLYPDAVRWDMEKANRFLAENFPDVDLPFKEMPVQFSDLKENSVCIEDF